MRNFILICALLFVLCAASSVSAKKRPQVAVVIAMDYEFAPFNTTMNLKSVKADKKFKDLPYQIYKKDNYRGIDYRFITFGYNKFAMANYPGKQNFQHNRKKNVAMQNFLLALLLSMDSLSALSSLQTHREDCKEPWTRACHCCHLGPAQ